MCIRTQKSKNSLFPEEKADIFSHKGDNTMAALQGDAAVVRRVNLTTEERKECFVTLLSMLKDKQLPRGSFDVVGVPLSVQRKTVSRLWNTLFKKLLSTITDPDGIPEHSYGTVLLHCACMQPDAFFQSGRKGNCGRRVVYDLEAVTEQVMELPGEQKGSVRAMAGGLGCSSFIVQKLKKEGLLKKHNSKVKPSLKQMHIDSRLMYCLEMIDPTTISTTRSTMHEVSRHV